MKKPNFFILGAPKCGTTSLTAWLTEHPHVYMSPVKEPNFFNTDMKGYLKYSLEAYEQLFEKADSRYLRIGEASSQYLFSQEAVPNILGYVENPSELKFIVSIRNPVDMAVSWHGQMLRSGEEVVKDFATAWHLQETRANGLSLPKFSEQTRFLYGPLCLLGAQLERLLRIVQREQVHVVVLDEIKADPQLEYSRILSFLGLPSDGKQQFPIHNAAKTLPSWAARLTVVIKRAKGRLNTRRGMGLNRWLVQKLYRPVETVPIDVETRMELQEYFKDDNALLGKILERDFSDWLKI